MPGTVNCKLPDAPVEVKILENGGPRWDPAELAEYLRAPAARPQREPELAGEPASSGEVLGGAYWLAQAERKAPGGRHNAGKDLAVQLRAAGLSYADAATWMERFAAHCEELGPCVEPAREHMARLLDWAYDLANFDKTPATAGGALPVEPEYLQDAPYTDDEPGEGAAQEGPTRNIELLRADAGNAARLARLYGNRLRFVPTWGWLAWDGARWSRDQGRPATVRAARRVALSFYNDAAGAASLGDEKNAAALAAWAKASLGRQRIEAMVALGESEPELWAVTQDFDNDPWALNVRNGILDLRTGDLRQHDPAALMTRLCPVDYDPGATSALWDSFLKTATDGDADLATYLQRFTGYCLTGSTAEEVVALLLGAGGTGKTTFVGALLGILGDYAAKATFDTFLQRRDVGGPRPDIAALAGARFVAACESEAKRRLAEVLVKELSGGDPVTARYLFHDQFTFKPAFKILLACNEPPSIRDDDTGIWRRLRKIPFDHVIPEEKRDPEVKRRLCDPSDAGPAILAWAVRGCLAWQHDRLGYPPLIRKATGELRESMDPLKDFLAECCVIDPGAQVTAGDLRDAYERWARENGQRETVTGKAWGERLRKAGAIQGRVGQAARRVRAWLGIGLLGQPALPEAE
jgi:putative DNA primase/helicase